MCFRIVACESNIYIYIYLYIGMFNISGLELNTLIADIGTENVLVL